MQEKQRTEWALKALIAGVASLALIISLIASIFGKEGEIREVSLIFGSVAAMVFGANLLKNK